LDDDRGKGRALLAWRILASSRKQLQSSPPTDLSEGQREKESIKQKPKEDISYSDLSSGVWEREMLEVIAKDSINLVNLVSSRLQLNPG
jgi:hypothetical protein